VSSAALKIIRDAVRLAKLNGVEKADIMVAVSDAYGEDG